jgi:alpha-ribazole phosphatase
MSLTIDLLRHGKVAGEPALYGRTDVELSPFGQQQMLSQLGQLGSVEHIISSPLQRCYNGAQAIAHNLKSQVTLTKLTPLQECDFGAWDGIPFAQLTQQWPQLDAFWQAPAINHLPGAESLADFHQRVISCWQQQILTLAKGHTLVVCHGGVIRQIIAHLLNLDWQSAQLYQQLAIGNGSLTRITLGDHANATPIIQFIGLPATEEAHHE